MDVADNAAVRQQTVKINDGAQDDDSAPASVNGTAAPGSRDELENKHISDIVDDLVNSAEPSVSGGSDTEASKSFKGKDEKGHARTSESLPTRRTRDDFGGRALTTGACIPDT